MCTDVNNDGKVDYMEFTERFHNPARDIGMRNNHDLTGFRYLTVGCNFEAQCKQRVSALHQLHFI